MKYLLEIFPQNKTSLPLFIRGIKTQIRNSKFREPAKVEGSWLWWGTKKLKNQQKESNFREPAKEEKPKRD